MVEKSNLKGISLEFEHSLTLFQVIEFSFSSLWYFETCFIMTMTTEFKENVDLPSGLISKSPSSKEILFVLSS